ncbi:MAG: hypothetical protein MUC50_02565 [Myxococcota bacterium]|nr:hypothetical protein [Myxococcota bacterium]
MPSRGDISEEEGKALTSEMRAQLRWFEFALGNQQPVREAAQRIAPSGLPSASQLAEIALSVQADVIFATVVIASEPAVHVVGFDLRRGAHRGVSATLPKAPAGGYTRELLRTPLHACLVALTKKTGNADLGALPSVRRVDLSGIGPGEATPAIDPYASPSPTPAPVTEPAAPVAPLPDDRWKKWKHEGFFMDLGFVLSYAFGDTLCRDSEKGLGGRLRAGYRFFEMLALSLSASGAAHEIPTGSIEGLAQTERFFFWAGVFGGLRFHPVRKFMLDPFVGLDLGWTWMMHFSKVPEETTDLEIPSEYQDDYDKWAGTRVTMTLQGFTLVPQAGLRLFLAPSFALGLTVEWQIPFYKRACVTLTETSTSGLQGGEKCGDPGTADVLVQDIGYDLTKSSELPKYLTMEFGLAFVF